MSTPGFFSCFCSFWASGRRSPCSLEVCFGQTHFPFGSEWPSQPSLCGDLKLNPDSASTPADPVYRMGPCLFFLQFAVEKLSELKLWNRELQGEAHTLIDFFCEDKETVKLDECFQIFRDFCARFNRAVKVWLWALPCFQSLGFSFLCPLTQSSAHGRTMVIGSLVSEPSGLVSWQVLGRDEWEVALV